MSLETRLRNDGQGLSQMHDLVDTVRFESKILTYQIKVKYSSDAMSFKCSPCHLTLNAMRALQKKTNFIIHFTQN